MNPAGDELPGLRRKVRAHRPGGLTDAELARLAAALRSRIGGQPAGSAAAVVLKQELDEILAEQQAREQEREQAKRDASRRSRTQELDL